MATILKPDTSAAVLEAVAWAAAEEVPLEIVGHGSKRGVGRPVQSEYTLDLSALTGVTLYEPDELVLSARAGTPIAEINELLAENDQELAFEPMDMGVLNGAPAGTGTIGGVLAANVSGPRRIKAGAARDHVLGIHAVSGRGEAFKSGGRVVKNVTGYDLSKGLAGSWGTLAVLTDVTFKVLPRSETQVTVALHDLEIAAAIKAMCAAMGSPWEVSSAAHLPVPTSAAIPKAGSGALTVLRVEGFGPSVRYRSDKLTELLKPFGEVEIIAADDSATLWRAIRDVEPLHGERPLWRVSVPPTHGLQVAIECDGSDARYVFDWSGGLVWVETSEEKGASARARYAAQSFGGHATLVRGSRTLRTAVSPFEPERAELAALSKRLKENFDPKCILNPGRMVAGI